MGFQKDFLWGAATAAYQIEGAFQEGGKGLNIWDALCKKRGRVVHGETGEEAGDHYHLYKEDVALMKAIGLNAYRFSINWSRILPDGTGRVNQEGVRFYSSLVDELLDNGIEPLVTLFHWDYPLSLYYKGGWMNDESPLWFEEYTKVVVDALSDRVKYWITINEPQIFTSLGYEQGLHAPFLKCSDNELLSIYHNVLLSHGLAVRTIRKQAKKDPKIGFAFTAPCASPKDDSEDAIKKAKDKTFSLYVQGSCFLGTSIWMDPIFLGDYPDEAYRTFGNVLPKLTPNDKEIITSPVEFIGINIYSSMANEIGLTPYDGNGYVGCPRTSMEWPVTPETLYWSPKFLAERYHKPIMITENGMANNDWVSLDGKVHDPQRIDFTHRYLRELKRAADDGVDVIGYMHWSLLDNFEWAYGYDKRFGLIHINYLTKKRTLKDSAYWYREVIRQNGANL